ncbi:MAG TPA: DUF1707 domain-containing protein, partial [Nocardioides sp.]|uniref:DUF1707 SHOCT-like domain-containing protein n=1 Tax=Nocardioides sp. TaxID=35761 RepID=UPI002E341B39
AYHGLRASDRDRAVVHDILASAYAEGRIDRDELDERTAQVDSAKTYADLVPPMRDLTADASSAPGVSPASRASLERQALGYYREKLGEAFMGFLVPNLIVWTIWFFAGHGFPWPAFVLIATIGNFVRVAAQKTSIVEARIEKLERKQARALEPPKPAGSSKSAGSSRSTKAPKKDEPSEHAEPDEA